MGQGTGRQDPARESKSGQGSRRAANMPTGTCDAVSEQAQPGEGVCARVDRIRQENVRGVTFGNRNAEHRPGMQAVGRQELAGQRDGR